MIPFETTVKRYIDIWNDTDAVKRRAAIDAVYVTDCSYTDPNAAVDGRGGIDALIGEVQRLYPGLVFTLSGGLDVHHSQARFGWQARMPGAAAPAVVGFDVVIFEGDRIRSVYGFLDMAPG